MKIKVFLFLVFVFIACVLSYLRIAYINEKNSSNKDNTYDLIKNNNDNYVISRVDDYKDNLKDINNKEKLELWCSIERKDNYNNELQYYSEDNVVLNNGEITITSKKKRK